jgi:hypothetical protein
MEMKVCNLVLFLLKCGTLLDMQKCHLKSHALKQQGIVFAVCNFFGNQHPKCEVFFYTPIT